MRSYATGKYAILKDGNFQLAISRACSLAKLGASVTIAIPEDNSDYEDLLKIVNKLSIKINFEFLKYSLTAAETRKVFYKLNDVDKIAKDLNANFIITDVTGYTGNYPFSCNFNITKLENLPRPYIDEFWESDLSAMRRAKFTTVLNPIQSKEILEKDPTIEIVDSQLTLNGDWIKACFDDHLSSEDQELFSDPTTIFWPFRISDKAYKFKEVLDIVSAQLPTYKFVITDPNESFNEDHKNVIKKTLSKSQYYRALMLAPIVIMLDDADLVFHPGTAEFLLFKCRLITMKNSLLKNQNQLQNINDLVPLLKLNESTKFSWFLNDVTTDIVKFINPENLYNLIHKNCK
jgi:hypothetical protein